MKIKLLLLFCLISAQIFSQDKFSFDSELSKNFHDSEKWKIDATLSLKELYSEADWQRWGLSGVVAHKRGVFTPKGGLAVYYTFDKYVVSKWELRPWVGVALRNKVRNGSIWCRKSVPSGGMFLRSIGSTVAAVVRVTNWAGIISFALLKMLLQKSGD